LRVQSAMFLPTYWPQSGQLWTML